MAEHHHGNAESDRAMSVARPYSALLHDIPFREAASEPVSILANEAAKSP